MALLTTSLRITYLLMYRSRREHLRLVYDRATADVEGCRGHRAGQVGGSEGGHIAYILKRRCPLEHRLPDDHFGDVLAPIEALRDRLGHPARLQRHCADTMRSELGGQLAAQGLHRVECDLESSQVVVRHRIPVAAEKENHPRSLRDHVPCCCPGGQELCPHGGHDRPSKSSRGISASGVPWTSLTEMRLKETSIPPALAATASACWSTACSSRASTCAASAPPPVERISWATSSRLSRV